MSLIAEQSTRMIAQILDDFERLSKELINVNIEEILEKRPDMASLIVLNLQTIRDQSNVVYTFLEAMHRIKDEG